MTKNFRSVIGIASGIVAAVSLSSCVDPYYEGTSYGASYSSGGYGGGSTSIFVSTGDPLWGYDPYSYSYYNYSTRRYYDPYLYGYYPIGYRPRPVYGVPHPCGWHPGMSHISPPQRVNNYTIRNYDDRAGAYRNSNYGWSKQVRPSDGGSRGFDSRSAPRYNQGDSDSRTRYNPGATSGSSFRSSQGDSDSRMKYNSRPDSGASFRSSQWQQDNSRISQPSFKPKENFKPREIPRQNYNDGRKESPRSLPSYYNTPVNNFHPEPQQAPRVMNTAPRVMDTAPRERAFQGNPVPRQEVPARNTNREEKSENHVGPDGRSWPSR